MTLNPNPHGAPKLAESQQMADAEPGWRARLADRAFAAGMAAIGAAVTGGLIWLSQHLGGHA